MPHNWTTAETMLLLRDMFVREDGDRLILLEGVPEKWIFPGAKFGVKDLPTHLGTVTFAAEVDSQNHVEIHFAQGSEIPYEVRLPRE